MRNLSQYIQPSSSGPTTCERCGAAFNCGAQSNGCWCSELKLTETVRAELRARYERCLCRACLESFAEPEKKAVEESNG